MFEGQRAVLLRLLRPLSAAAESSPLVRALVEAGTIYRAVRWSPQEAFAFLEQIPACEAAGVLVRVPNWWRNVGVRLDAKPELLFALRGAHPQELVGTASTLPGEVASDRLLDASLLAELFGVTIDDEAISRPAPRAKPRGRARARAKSRRRGTPRRVR